MENDKSKTRYYLIEQIINRAIDATNNHEKWNLLHIAVKLALEEDILSNEKDISEAIKHYETMYPLDPILEPFSRLFDDVLEKEKRRYFPFVLNIQITLPPIVQTVCISYRRIVPEPIAHYTRKFCMSVSEFIHDYVPRRMRFVWRSYRRFVIRIKKLWSRAVSRTSSAKRKRP